MSKRKSYGEKILEKYEDQIQNLVHAVEVSKGNLNNDMFAANVKRARARLVVYIKLLEEMDKI